MELISFRGMPCQKRTIQHLNVKFEKFCFKSNYYIPQIIKCFPPFLISLSRYDSRIQISEALILMIHVVF